MATPHGRCERVRCPDSRWTALGLSLATKRVSLPVGADKHAAAPPTMRTNPPPRGDDKAKNPIALNEVHGPSAIVRAMQATAKAENNHHSRRVPW